MIGNGTKKAALLVESLPKHERNWLLTHLTRDELAIISGERVQARKLIKSMRLNWKETVALIGLEFSVGDTISTSKNQEDLLKSLDDATLIGVLNGLSPLAVWILTHSTVLNIRPFYLAMLNESLVIQVQALEQQSFSNPSAFVVQQLVGYVLSECENGNS